MILILGGIQKQDILKQRTISRNSMRSPILRKGLPDDTFLSPSDWYEKCSSGSRSQVV